MSFKIYYFSATGNSLEIARQIAKGLEDCTIESMSAPQSKEPVGGSVESIGFVFPVYYVGLPLLVKEFVEKLNILPETYCFAVINYGRISGNTLGMLENILQKKGIGLSYADGVKMPGNYIVSYSSHDPDKVKEILKNGMIKVDEVIKAITKGSQRPVKKNILSRLLTKIAYPSLYRNIAEWDEKFVATDACTCCRLCYEICPVENIKIEDCHPVWQHHCEKCLRCIQWCPTEAIQYGKKTIERRRYHNPHVKADNFIEESRIRE
ncbi:MAG: EFR1 family ferrodoxin [Methanobacterium sp.]|jgi:flavodoxin/ferredoxin